MCINTDDIGVFATSLENEYALLLVAERERRKVQHGCDDCQDIYDYLDRIRENGFRVSFGKKADDEDKEDEFCENDIDEKQERRLLKWLKKMGKTDIAEDGLERS